MSSGATSPAIPDALVEALRSAESLGVITGAGVSAASGVVTYRGRGGLYDDPEEGDRTVEALSGPTLRTDPDRTWRAVAKLARMSRGAAPNPAHRALVDLERCIPRFVLLTQNVDGLHQAAGSRNVIAIHGDISRTVCLGCGRPGGEPDWSALDRAPRCPACNGLLRPDVVLFGELLPEAGVSRMHRELIQDVPDVVMAVGTTALFPYIAEPVAVARHLGRCTAEINPERTVVTPLVDHGIPGFADEVLPALVAALDGSGGGGRAAAP